MDAIGLGASQRGSRAPGLRERGSSTAAVSDNKSTGVDQLSDELTPGLYCLTDVVRKKNSGEESSQMDLITTVTSMRLLWGRITLQRV